MSPSQTRYRWTQLVATTTTLSHILALVSAACFLPNSTDRNSIGDGHGGDYLPTGFGSSVDNFQMCCATNGRAVPDIPRKDGLCQNLAAIWRESCTDPTWESPSCIKLCIDGISTSSPTTPSLLHALPNANRASHRRRRRSQKRRRQQDHAMSRLILLLRRPKYNLLPTGQRRLDRERPTYDHQPQRNPGHNCLHNAHQSDHSSWPIAPTAARNALPTPIRWPWWRRDCRGSCRCHCGNNDTSSCNMALRHSTKEAAKRQHRCQKCA